MLYRGLLLALATAHAWNDCAFPDVGYFTVDEGIGISFAYGAAGMNGSLYSGGYYKGHLALIGVTDSGEVLPEPAATLWGDVQSDVQNLFLAETNAAGKMTKSWPFATTGIQVGLPGHGPNVAQIQTAGIVAMLNKQHLAVRAAFTKCTITLPDGRVWVSSKRPGDNTDRENPSPVQIVMKVDVSSATGVGAAPAGSPAGSPTGWARLMDCDHNGNTDTTGNAAGVSSLSHHGDTNGDMIVSYKGCATWNATFQPPPDRYGRPQAPGAGVDCKHYLSKLAAADGSDVWKHELPTRLWSCKPINDGSIFCGYTTKAADAEMDFGNNVKVAAAAADAVSSAVIVKFNTAGVAQWAKLTHAASFTNLAISPDGTLLAINGGGAANQGVVSRVDTATGAVLWTDDNGGGSTGGHGGYRDIAVTATEVVVTGSMMSDGATVTLTDTAASAVTLRNRGHYEIYVAAFNAGDGQPQNGGKGKWAIAGGGDGGEYFFNFATDPDTNDIYVGGGVYDAPEFFQMGDVKRTNAMYHPSIAAGSNGGRGTKRASPVGDTKAFTAQIKSTTTLPACLTTCDAVYGRPQASDIKDGHCYIERHCYSAGDFAPYPGAHCMKCDPTMNKLDWTGPDTTSHCFIDGKCVTEGTIGRVVTSMGHNGPTYASDPCSKCIPSASTTGYSPVAEKGCKLDMATFTAACYDDKGSVTMTEAAKLQLMADKTSMTETVATRDATIVAMATKNVVLTLTASGSVSDHSDTLILQQGVATAAGVDKSLVTIEVTAGSVVVTATIAVPASTTADKMQASLSSTLGTVAAASTALGITVESPPTMAITTKKDADTTEMPTWAIAIIVIVAAMFFLVLVILAVVVSREQQGKPVFVPTSMKKSVGTPGV